MIANSIPQTAEVNREEAKFEPKYDGEPRFDDVPDTSLQYAVNTPMPVVRVDATSYYAVQSGVWFTGGSPFGPWLVATSVPAVIYSIPTASPIHYVTYVRVYRYSPTTVWVGYTPGYMGTCYAPWGTVVYGTGWHYRPWIGTTWYGAPMTWGFGVGIELEPMDRLGRRVRLGRVSTRLPSVVGTLLRLAPAAAAAVLRQARSRPAGVRPTEPDPHQRHQRLQPARRRSSGSPSGHPPGEPGGKCCGPRRLRVLARRPAAPCLRTGRRPRGRARNPRREPSRVHRPDPPRLARTTSTPGPTATCTARARPEAGRRGIPASGNRCSRAAPRHARRRARIRARRVPPPGPVSLPSTRGPSTSSRATARGAKTATRA